MAVTQRGETKRMILAGVFLVSHSNKLSSNCTTAANTFSRGSPRRARSRETCSRMPVSAEPKAIIRAYFVSSRIFRHCGWYRYCLRPLESRPVACRWPHGSAQIHTSVQAGGSTSVCMRASTSVSRTGRPLLST